MARALVCFVMLWLIFGCIHTGSLEAQQMNLPPEVVAYADTIGTYFFVDKKRVKITAASFSNGTFKIERVIPEGKREMDYAASLSAQTRHGA